MLYSSLYRSFLTPNNATGEGQGPFLTTTPPYFDSMYTSWDTFRTFYPLMALSSPQEYSNIAENYIDAWRKTGFVPEARCNNLPGWTQGGIAFIVGLVNTNWGFACLDCATHLAEEVVQFVLAAGNPSLVAVAITGVVAPIGSALALGTIASHVACLTTNTTDNAGGEVLLLGTVVFAMTNFSTVLAGLVLVVSEGTVEGGELAELVALEFVLTFGDRSSLQTVSIAAGVEIEENLQSQ